MSRSLETFSPEDKSSYKDDQSIPQNENDVSAVPTLDARATAEKPDGPVVTSKSKGVIGMELLASRLNTKYFVLLYGGFVLLAYTLSLGEWRPGSSDISLMTILRPIYLGNLQYICNVPSVRSTFLARDDRRHSSHFPIDLAATDGQNRRRLWSSQCLYPQCRALRAWLRDSSFRTKHLCESLSPFSTQPS